MSSDIWQRLKGGFHKDPPKTRLTESDVLDIAAQYLASQGDYRLREPYNIGIEGEEDGLLWHICDSINTRGGNYHMQISDATGQIVKTWATPK